MKKTGFAWFLLIVFICIALVLSYFKFSTSRNRYITEISTENSTSQAIRLALTQIVTNFNNDDMITQYRNQNIDINAVLKNHSIFISEQTDVVVTYEFSYNNMNLSIIIDNDERNVEKFNRVLFVLIRAIQKRLNNNENIDSSIESFLKGEKQFEGMSIVQQKEQLKIDINITKKISVES